MLLSGEKTRGYRLLPVAQRIPDCAKVLPEHQDRSSLAHEQGEDQEDQEGQQACSLLGSPSSLDKSRHVLS